MKDFKFTNFKSFLNAVQSITKEVLEKAKRLLKTNGKDIDSIDDIFVNNNGELFELLPDGSLVRVNLYIATQNIDYYANFKNFTSNDIQYKYHIFKCGVISNMFNTGRKHRYKINNRDNGTFYYTFTNSVGNIIGTNENQKIDICRPCLKKFLNQKYMPSIEDAKNFKLETFHNENNNSFFDIDTSNMEQGEYAQANVYSPMWDKISRQIKINRNYTCEKCGYIPKSDYDKRYIHTHHQNGDKQNNGEDNLQVLCIKCHSEVDSFHARIKGSANYKDYISKIIE
jgi:hypothetical protein